MASTLPRDNACNTCCTSDVCCDSTTTLTTGTLTYETVAIAKVNAPDELGVLVAITGADAFDTSGFFLSEAAAEFAVDDVNTFIVGAVYYNRKII